MTLAQYLKQTGLSDTAFGNKCRPKIHRTKIFLYRKGEASPRADKIDAIERATNYRVRARDLMRRPNGHNGSSGKVAHS